MEEALNPGADKNQIAAAKVSIIGSIILFFISTIVGIAVDSITLLLDAGASLVIVLVSFLMRFSIKKVHLPPDEQYNFGYTKFEPLTVVLQGVFIIVTCLVSIKFAIQDIVHADDIINGYRLPVIATFVSGIIGFFIYAYLKNAASRANSMILKTASVHWHADMLLSFGLCLGFIGGLIMQRSGYYKITPYIDPLMAIVLALVLIQIPVKAIIKNISELLDAAPDDETRNKISKVVEIHKPKSFGVERIRVRKAGSKVFVDICFLVESGKTAQEVQCLSEGFEADLKKHITGCDTVVYCKPVEGRGK